MKRFEIKILEVNIYTENRARGKCLGLYDEHPGYSKGIIQNQKLTGDFSNTNIFVCCFYSFENLLISLTDASAKPQWPVEMEKPDLPRMEFLIRMGKIVRSHSSAFMLLSAPAVSRI